MTTVPIYKKQNRMNLLIIDLPDSEEQSVNARQDVYNGSSRTGWNKKICLQKSKLALWKTIDQCLVLHHLIEKYVFS